MTRMVYTEPLPTNKFFCNSMVGRTIPPMAAGSGFDDEVLHTGLTPPKEPRL